MIEICCIIIFIFGLIACFITILQGLKVGREQYDNTLNKYQYWRNRTVKDHDIREGFPYEGIWFSSCKILEKTSSIFHDYGSICGCSPFLLVSYGVSMEMSQVK